MKEEIRVCTKCFLTKNIIEFGNTNVIYKGTSYLRRSCLDCYSKYNASEERRAKQNEYRKTEKYKAKRREYRKTTRTKEREYENRYLAKDPLVRVRKNIRNRTRIALKVKRWLKTTKFYDYIGCSQDELKQHLESKFQPGMSWENYGKWEIDHIIPLASAQNEQEMYKLSHYTNLQPLWMLDNVRKSNKIL